ncbi:MAG TPA: hypothetical protein VEJ89_01730 [Myxococcaceae bacterium]|nr:hypothetical protein [Myxococcaceae bacterium]
MEREPLLDIFDELNRFREVFERAQRLVAPIISEQAQRLEAMAKGLRKFYGPSVDPFIRQVDDVLATARRFTEPMKEIPLEKMGERRSADRRRPTDAAPLPGLIPRSR